MIAIIAAMAKNRVIGNKGRIPWTIPEDMKHFKKLTTGSNIIMGRKTFEEIGRPLPERTTYLISSQLQVETPDCHTVKSLHEALMAVGNSSVFICGGAMLYQEALAFADRLYLTVLDYNVQGDVFFPEIPPDKFIETERRRGMGEYSFLIYKKK